MALRIEDYAIIGNMRSAAMVGIEGSIEWLALPRFDAGAFFASLLGTEANGCWLLQPSTAVVATHRHYRDDTLILETEITTQQGVVVIIDFMPIAESDSKPLRVVRLVAGKSGRVSMKTEMMPCFDYGRITPWLSPCI